MCSVYIPYVCVVPQGTWVMEGETLKGTFTRKDNGKLLTTTRSLVGGELVQVTYTHTVTLNT